MKLAGLLLVAIAGCYHPNGDQPCAITCESSEPCPGNLTCSAGFCTTAGVTCSGGDGGADAAPFCFGHLSPAGLGQICIPSPTSNTLLTYDTVIDTSLGVSCTLGSLVSDPAPAVQVCYVTGIDLTIQTGTFSGVLRAIGARPLVLIASHDIIVEGALDVASHVADLSHPHAGADDPGCDSLLSPTLAVGGAGGSFATAGGDGGSDGGSHAGGHAGATAMPSLLRGGCPGQAGGNAGGAGGPSGGAVYLIALDQITGSGSINASGAGGAGDGTGLGGGGGGGAGGMVAFDAPMTSFTGTVIANGGGGGAGGIAMGTAEPGADPAVEMPTHPALGGIQPGHQLDSSGGPGAATTGDGTGGGSANGATDGGGGGGGGMGWFRVFPASLGNVLQTTAMTSPAPM